MAASYVWVLVIANNPIPAGNSVLQTLVIANDPKTSTSGRQVREPGRAACSAPAEEVAFYSLCRS
jgi:hypothetical protein